jgi:hypothetical protein
MAMSSSKESSAARIAYASRAATRASHRVTPLLRDALAGASSLPLREISARASVAHAPTLPVLATAGDVRELVRLLKKRDAGLTLVAAMNSEQKRIFDPRKIAAYEFWGIIVRDGERIRLTTLGAEMARRLEPEAHIYRAILDQIIHYRSVLESVFHQRMDLVTHLDVAAYWKEHYPEAIDEHDEKTVEASVVCFFHLCQEAELGTMTVGKRGQPARLHVERKGLSGYIQSKGPSLPAETFGDKPLEENGPATRALQSTHATQHKESSEARRRLLISHCQQREVVEQIRVTLEIAGIESETVERKVSAGAPVAEHILQAMRRSTAALIVVSAQDCSTNDASELSLNEDVLVEIGAAFVFYDGRVVLLWDEAVAVPSNLRKLSRCRFASGRLTWEDGVSLMRAIKELKD